MPWDFTSSVLGASVPDNTEWNNTVLGQDGQYVSFVDAHYYPFVFDGATGGSNPSVPAGAAGPDVGPLAYGQIRAALAASDPGAQVVIGETGVSNNETTTVCTPDRGAVRRRRRPVLAGRRGAERGLVGHEQLRQHQRGSAPTRTTGCSPRARRPCAETPYYGYVLASVLAQPHAMLATMGTSDPADVLAYQSRLPGGTRPWPSSTPTPARPRR